MTSNQTRDAVLHVRYDGCSSELSLSDLNLSRQSSDAQIKTAVAAYFDRPVPAFERFVVVRTSQAIIVRPEAIYG